ncbi:hypothetical protein MCOR14_010588 [Pyricularia oryzae]|uniref:Protein kinase domain-containing protein n=1 Tax=Pyricularia oryzae TaxID=318829 RepID=A0A4P7NBQ4_PYROR|nr:hypothetical protein MCOR34_011023 [Pyricularia oryzae]KAI6443936.1 hypothetical protein MCOR17_011297 [Pyricularia oryzae]KAI6618641.1 hypothetical protein MCOR14_010588 [Pyricularia oryzae]QBZ58536.1 hypothetical protein PoMZ_03490 [Pyricularia oryzae]
MSSAIGSTTNPVSTAEIERYMKQDQDQPDVTHDAPLATTPAQQLPQNSKALTQERALIRHVQTQSTDRNLTDPSFRSPAELSTEMLTAALERATLDSLPNARLVLASTGPLKSSHSIPLKSSIGAWGMVGIVQRTQDVNFTICLPFYDPPSDNTSRMIPNQLVCKIYYDPGRESCLFLNASIFEITLTYLGPKTTEKVVSTGKQLEVWPGLWRITYTSEKFGTLQHLVDFLILRKKFKIFTQRPQQAASEFPLKHKIEDYQHTASKRRKGDDNILETIVAPATKPLSSTVANQAAEHGPETRQLQLVQCKGTPFLPLENGDVAIVRSTLQNPEEGEHHSTDPANYELTRIKLLGKTTATVVFAGRHSGLEKDIAVKVMRYKGESRGQLVRSADSWEREKKILEPLDHPNIMSLIEFDGRLLALYVELLPRSLRDVRPRLEHASEILHNMASALDYLGKMGIAHNDIKPGNIAFSPARGAVLIDFGMATTLGHHRAGGTPKYMAPEYWTSSSSSSAGEVWALGTTMLYVLGKVVVPEEFGKNVDIVKFEKGDPDERLALNTWLKIVGGLRDKLSKDLIEGVVHRMLETDVKLRIPTAKILGFLGQIKQLRSD